MEDAFVIGEDELCVRLAARLVSEVLQVNVRKEINTNGVTKLRAELPRYVGPAGIHRVGPVICLADTDGKCAPAWLAACNLPVVPDNFFLRLAVSESENWVIADRQGFADFFGVKVSSIPAQIAPTVDTKLLLLNSLKGARLPFRTEMLTVQKRLVRPGTGYNMHLANFVSSTWDYRRASVSSESLQRSVARLEAARQASATEGR